MIQKAPFLLSPVFELYLTFLLLPIAYLLNLSFLFNLAFLIRFCYFIIQRVLKYSGENNRAFERKQYDYKYQTI